VLEEVGLGPAADSARLLAVWNEALGPELAPHCQLDGVRRGVIWVNVRDSAWMQRVQLEKPRILARLEAALGGPVATDLRLRVGWRR
jgi:predicted nucleic acid-binding Zn ribbon protein